MGMTAATVDPVLCICILDVKSLSVTDVKGFDYRASISYDSSNTMAENMGEVKAPPRLPVYKFRGKLIPDLIYISPNLSIRSSILTGALKYLYQLYVFERRQYVPTPFGLLDGYRIRLRLLLLEYIKSTTTDGMRKWIFTLRTPNVTNV